MCTTFNFCAIYRITGVSFKHYTEDSVKACFYPKHDDGATGNNVKPYWVKISSSEGAIMSYDLPFRFDMKSLTERYPISSDKKMVKFVNYIQRCCESFFERRQQVQDLEVRVM
jgi:hypothetical protein